MRFGQFQYLVDHQEWLPVWQDIHNLYRIIQRRHIGVVNLGVFTALFLLNLCFYLLRSEEHTSELQSLMRISYAVFCLKKKKQKSMNNMPDNIKKDFRKM